jgi:hypothetical protein
MQARVMLFFLLCSFLIISACEKNFAKKHTGDYYFTTDASSYMGDANNDSTLFFYGIIVCDSKSTLRIEYGPVLMTPSNSTLYAKIYVAGIIYPTVDADGNLTYPDYLAKDLHYFFHGSFEDNGGVSITLGFDGLGAGYSNTIHGIRSK